MGWGQPTPGLIRTDTPASGSWPARGAPARRRFESVAGQHVDDAAQGIAELAGNEESLFHSAPDASPQDRFSIGRCLHGQITQLESPGSAPSRRHDPERRSRPAAGDPGPAGRRIVYAAWPFPASEEERSSVSARAQPSGRETEIGMIHMLPDWPQPAQEAVRQSLARRYLIRLIREIRQLRTSARNLLWPGRHRRRIDPAADWKGPAKAARTMAPMDYCSPIPTATTT